MQNQGAKLFQEVGCEFAFQEQRRSSESLTEALAKADGLRRQTEGIAGD